MARIRTLVAAIALALASSAVPVPATAQCDPTCAQDCKAQRKACLAALANGQAVQLAQCTMSVKLGGASCAFLAALGKSTACLGKCGMELDGCKAAIKDDVADCKSSVKSTATSCRTAAKDMVAQGKAACEQDHTSCLAKCT